MSEKQMLQNIKELTDSIRLNVPVVRERLTKAGAAEPDDAIVASAAKYHEALRLLADE